MKIYRYTSNRDEVVKLIVGGLHGNEGKIVSPILNKLKHIDLNAYGEIILIPCISHGGRYVSTLSMEYYKTRPGRTLLRLIDTFKPNIYVEVHCYRKSAYRRLTDPFRRFSMGVPPLLSLNDGLLIGAALPQLFRVCMFDLGLVIEKTCRKGGEKELLGILKLIAESSGYQEVISKLSLKYPQQISRIVAYHSLIKSKIKDV